MKTIERANNSASLPTQNARQHGATARPAAEDVATWLRVILDCPDLRVEEVMSNSSELLSTARRLAEAEASIVLADKALDAALAEPDPAQAEPTDIRLAMYASELLRGDLTKAAEIIRGYTRLDLEMKENQIRERRRRIRLLKRYASEARGSRRAAFRDWRRALAGE